jgi:hypothetical protein
MSSLRSQVLKSLLYVLPNVIFTGVSGNPAPPIGGFWQRTYPQGTPRPVVLIDVGNSPDDLDTPQRSASIPFTIRCVSEVSYKEARDILLIIENAFYGKVLTLETWRTYAMNYVDSPISLEEPRDGGEWFYTEGDNYVLYADKEGL